MRVETFAGRLVRAWRTGDPAEWRDMQPPDLHAAYSVQDIVAAELGAVAGWKVGARGPDAEPICAPCPASGVFDSGSTLTGPRWRLRGVEVEIGLRLGRDLAGSPSRADCIAAVEAVVPVIEVVETRLADWSDTPALAKLADFQSHGALVLGAPASLDPATLNLSTTRAELVIDGQAIASMQGGNPAGDIWRLVAWLAGQAEARKCPLRAGAIITTGSCTGMAFAGPGARVQARLVDIGDVDLNFARTSRLDNASK